MSLRKRIDKLIERCKVMSQKNFFIISNSKDDEDEQIAKIKLEHNFEDSIITVFKLYD